MISLDSYNFLNAGMLESLIGMKKAISQVPEQDVRNENADSTR
jgi:hypothetical protein